MQVKICTKCLITKPITRFSARKDRKSGYCSWCKDCLSESSLLWKKTHTERVKKSYIDNKEKINAKSRKWALEHPERMREFIRKHKAKHRKTINGKLSSNVATNICHSLKRGAKRRQTWESIVGYTVEQLKHHLEKQFVSGMAWENYGTIWHIDHKIPVKVFNFVTPEDLDFKRCWALSNLQPMEAHENRVKHAKIDSPFQPSLRMSA